MNFYRPLPGVLSGALWASTLVSVLSHSSAFADEAGQTTELDPIVVTATLGPRTVGESLSSVTVVSEEDIRQQQPKEFRELIESQPGVSVTSNGSFGKQTSVFMRGQASDGTVLLVDGVRIRSATVGGPAWQYLPPQLLKRVEIVRGSRSSLYGADAVGGVVQAFTLPREEGTNGWIEAGAGNFDSQQYGAGFSSVTDQTQVSIGANSFRTDGAPVVEGGPDKGYDNISGVASARHKFDNGVKVGVSSLSAEGNTEYVGGNSDFRFQTVGFNVEVPITSYWRTSLHLADARDELEAFSGNAGVFDTRTRSSRLENWFTAGTHEFVLGAENLVDDVDSTRAYEETSRSNKAFFGQALLNFGPTDLHLSLRNDDNEAYGTEETWGAGLGYQIAPHYRLRASVGTSFKAPSFNDLYFPNYGNPDLEPEEAISYEVGAEARYDRWFWDLAVYQSDVEDLLLPSQNQTGSVPEARLRGIELSSGWQHDGWSIKAVASVGSYEDKDTGLQLIRRAERTIRLDLDKQVGSWSFGTTARAESQRYDQYFDMSSFENVRTSIAGFGVWDLRASKTLAPGWRASLSVDNVLDNEYATIKDFSNNDYIAAGRTAFLSVRYDFVR